MWIVNAVIVHLLLLGSIFVIYFRSPVLTGLQPQIALTDLGYKPPAKRLVLIVTDGLRAESFFRNNCEDVPHLRNLLLQKGGLVGVSHTRVPTESRPGHIALIAGLYEDPSAVLRGWKENPIDFDTVFNRSLSTYAWGADDVLHIFSRLDDGGKQRLFFEAYDHDLDFSGRNDTFALDEWVFARVKFLLGRKSVQLQNEEQIIFFLHLLGLDSAGHIHKPGSKEFLSNLHNTEREIVEIYHSFERTFPDGKTVYLLTSDHGMTDAGSHGAGANFETETPFYIWGAGIAANAPNKGKTFRISDEKSLPLHEMEQAQMAPLMSALIGIAPPMNNFGTLPFGYMAVDRAYEAAAAHSNALQLLAQFKLLFEEHQNGLLATLLRRYKPLDMQTIEAYEVAYKKELNAENYDKAIASSQVMMHLALEGIDYYHGYYRNVLLICTSLAFLGWKLYLLQLLLVKNSPCASSYPHNKRLSTPFLFFLATFVLCFVYLQQVPLIIAFYLLLPIFVWMLALSQRFPLTALWHHYKMHKLQLLMLVCCAEILVLAFFRREIISLAFLIFAVMNNMHAFPRHDYRFYLWLILITILTAFPLLPPTVGYKNEVLLIVGMSLSLCRPFLVKSRLRLGFIGIAVLALLNAFYCIYCNSQRLPVPSISLLISWCYLIYTFLILLWQSKANVLKLRLELTFFSLTAFYNLLCTSYETIFIIMLASELLLSLAAHENTQTAIAHSTMPPNTAQHLRSSFRLAFTILLYTFFSFFGTGNIASVSSFDPNIIRCFLTTFLPFVIMALVILKLIIPVILNICIIYGMSDFARHNERQIFICVLLICDIMGLNFLFFVRNTGSWLDIGTSISHFVIMQVTTLGLVLFTLPAKVFLNLQTVAPMSLKLK